VHTPFPLERVAAERVARRIQVDVPEGRGTPSPALVVPFMEQ
jgi:hypothetical protein